MSFASTVPEGGMDIYESQTSASSKGYSDSDLEKWKSCASQSCRSLLNIMCNQDSLYKSSDSMEEVEDQQTDLSEEENTFGTTGM
jgi:hypothetical protein